MNLRFRWLFAGLLVLPLGCTRGSGAELKGAEPPARSTGSVESRPLPPLGREAPRPAPDDWSPNTQRQVVLRAQNIVLQLPQAQKWQPLSRRGTWSGMGHQASGSEIWVRHVPARRTVSLDECEAEARFSWPLIREAEEPAVEQTLQAPQGYGGRVSVVLTPEGGGRVEAFSVGVSRCLAVVFLTGSDPGFPERLRVGTNEIIGTMRIPNIGERTHLPRMSP